MTAHTEEDCVGERVDDVVSEEHGERWSGVMGASGGTLHNISISQSEQLITRDTNTTPELIRFY